MSCRHHTFPFTAIVGQEQLKKALILNAINPALGGVLIRGEKGTAKSTAVRSLAKLLPQIKVVENCPFNCDPYNHHNMCPECLKKKAANLELPEYQRKMKVIELPLGATEDRVLGTLDIEQAIKKGQKIFEPGILAAANRGILYVDEVNLLEDHLVDILLDSAAMGLNTVEREGVSFSHPAHFILIGTMNPEEGEPRPQLLDRFGMCVEVKGILDPAKRVQVMQRRIQFEKDHHNFEDQWQEAEANLCQDILQAQALLPDVTYRIEMLELIAKIAIDMGVDGHRADIFMLKTAQTLAAYYQRNEVMDTDIKEAAELVLAHRMRKKPFQEPQVDKDKLQDTLEKHSNNKQNNNEQPQSQEQENSQNKPSEQKETPNEKSETTFEIGYSYDVKKIAWSSEKEIIKGSGNRLSVKSADHSGRYVKSAIPQKKTTDIAFDATLRSSAPYQLERHQNSTDLTTALKIETKDLRQKIRQKKIGSTIIFVVDSSGSMGANQRMVETKGAIISLLTEAYQKRDKVGLVAFKQDKAELLLQPTSSVELAKKQLENLPTGGKTPLSAGLFKGLQVLSSELKKDKNTKAILILISDGKANVSLHGGHPFEEACIIAQDIKDSGIKSLILDTDNSFIQIGKLAQLNENLGGKYCKLADIRSNVIKDMVKTVSV